MMDDSVVLHVFRRRLAIWSKRLKIKPNLQRTACKRFVFVVVGVELYID